MSECVFCQIVAGEAPGVFVREWNQVVAIEPLEPLVPGHVLVLPREHVPDFMSNPAVTLMTVGWATSLARELGLGAANLLTTAGAAAGQSVFHFHVHLLPRQPGDGLVLARVGRRVS